MTSFHQRLTTFGISLGVCFPVIGIILDIYFKGFSFSFSSIEIVHQTNPIHWIIDSAPLVLGAVFYFLGKNIAERESHLKLMNADIERKCLNISGFVEALNMGNYDAAYDDKDENDILLTLTKFRDSLKQKNAEEQVRSWTNEGLAKFSELFTANAENLSVFCQGILSELVPYVSASQGAIFVLREEGENSCLEALACYAWDKTRSQEVKIRKGEKLVGQCWVEQKPIHLATVPSSYISITSGLGESLPRSVLLLPLKTKDLVMGVIELASFEPLEAFKVAFLEKLAENLGAVLQTLTTNDQVRFLLQQSRQQTEEMGAHEEEMRQNMEEMQATQEEFIRKERHYLETIQNLESKNSHS